MTPDFSIAWLIFNIFLAGITLVWGIFRYRRGIWLRKPSLKFLAYLLWGIGGVALVSSVFPFSYLYTEHLWFFETVAYDDVFWNIRKIRWSVFALFFLVALGFMNINAAIANLLCPEPGQVARRTRERTVSFHRAFFFGSVILALLFAMPMVSLQNDFIRYLNQPKVVETALAKPELENDPDVVTEQENNQGETEQEDNQGAVTDEENNQNPTAVPEDNQNVTTEPRFFGKDVNFYLFSYPIYKAVSLWIEILLWVTGIVVGLLYNFYYRRDTRSKTYAKRNIVLHGSILWLVLLAVGIWRAHVNLWGKVYTKSATPTLSKLYGLFYMDSLLVGSTLVYCGILIGIGVVVVINLFWRRRLLWYIAIAVWGVSYVLLIHVYPRVSHFVNVQADELTFEGEHLEKHIASTRAAFDLDTIVEKKYTAGAATLELVNKAENREVLENVQLWDRRVLYDVLRAEHLVKHHNFYPYTDIDRYRIKEAAPASEESDGESPEFTEQYRQVLIAAREIEPDPDVLGVRGNWRRRKLYFTHGYGVYTAPVNMVDEKYPVFWTEVKLDPKKFKNQTSSVYPELEVTQPRIYYGEMTNDYVLVNTKVSEYDFESEGAEVLLETDQEAGNETDSSNKYHYEGTGGVQLSGWLRRLLFSVRFLDLQILYNKNAVLSSESRIMFWRKIGTRRGQKVVSDRISQIAPFLDYDPDPYIVIDNGQLWWVVDFYVTSKWYPNAQFYEDDTAEVPDSFQDAERRFANFNYIRNSGVATVNAFSGEVNFYAVKDNEAIMVTYQKAFPNLFKGFDEMPVGLQAHLRFPDYLTRIQSKIYKDYHVENSDTFHGKGRQLKMPKEVYGNGKKTPGGILWKDDQEMMPYYAMIRLPGEERMEFVNMIPFTPSKKELNMKAWLVARCDPPHYGQRVVYTLTNTPEIKGPKHVEDLITSDLSKTFLEAITGNVVMRSGLYFIPLDEGIFYVEAIYKKPDAGEQADKKKDERPKRPMLLEVAVVANDILASDVSFHTAVKKVVEVGQKLTPASRDDATNKEKEPTLSEQLEEFMKSYKELGENFEKMAEIIKTVEKEKGVTKPKQKAPKANKK